MPADSHLRQLLLAVAVVAGLGCGRRETPSSLHDLDAGAALEEEACVDRWLAFRGLDVFGSPKGTIYPGGSPAFDETTGRAVSRLEHVYAQHPEARRDCGTPRELP